MGGSGGLAESTDKPDWIALELSGWTAVWDERDAPGPGVTALNGTGSNGSIGLATCRRLAQSGHLTVGIDVGAERADIWPHYQCDLRDLARIATHARRYRA
jgi:hypothetical protein